MLSPLRHLCVTEKISVLIKDCTRYSVPQGARLYQEEMKTFHRCTQDEPSMPQTHDGLGKSRHRLRSGSIPDVPIRIELVTVVV
jgi:hypothetical protein